MGIKRPTKVQKGQKNYLTNERYQDYAENQFKTIYDYLDAKVGNVLYDNKSNLSTSITLLDNATNYDCLEILYKVSRESKWIKGSLKVHSPDGYCFNVNTLFSTDSTHQKGNTALYQISGNTIQQISGSVYEINHDEKPIMAIGNYVYITRVIGYK